MSTSVALVTKSVPGHHIFSTIDFTLDSAYVNGTGYALSPANFGLSTLNQVVVLSQGQSGFIYNPNPGATDVAAFALKCYKATGSAAALTECATNDSNLNGVVVRILGIGRG